MQHAKTTLPGKIETFLRVSMLSSCTTYGPGYTADTGDGQCGAFVIVQRGAHATNGRWYRDVTGREIRKARNYVLGWGDGGLEAVHPLLRALADHERRSLFGDGGDSFGSTFVRVRVGRVLAYQCRINHLLETIGTYCPPDAKRGAMPEPRQVKLTAIAPESSIKQHHITIDNACFFELLWAARLYRPKLDGSDPSANNDDASIPRVPKLAALALFLSDRDLLRDQWEAAFNVAPSQKRRSFFKDAFCKEPGRGLQIVTDSVAASVLFLQPVEPGGGARHKPWEQRDKNCTTMDVHGERNRRPPAPAPDDHVWAVDPGRVSIVTAVKVHPAPPKGEEPEVRTLGRRGFYRAAHYPAIRAKNAAASEHMQQAFDGMSAHSRKVPGSLAYMAAIAAEAAVFDGAWSLLSRRAAGAYRLEKHIYSNRALDKFWASVQKAAPPGAATTVLYGAAKISAGGRGEVSVPVMGVLRRCRRFFRERLVLVDEYGTTKFHSACETELAKDVRRQLSASEKAKRAALCARKGWMDDSRWRLTNNRGLQRCPTCSGCLVSRDVDAAKMIARCYYDRPACCRRGGVEDAED
jgi:hypothetical protein